VFPLVVGAMVILAFRTTPRPGWDGNRLGVSLAVAGLALVVAGALLRGVLGPTPGTAPGGLLALLVASSAALMWFQRSGPGSVGLLLAVVFGIRIIRGRPGMLLAVAGAALFLVFLGLDAGGAHFAGKASVGLVGIWLLASMLLAAVFGRRVVKQEEQADQMLAELEHTRGADVRAAALAERQRLAREMHDVLAHSLSGLLVQLEGARLLAAADPSADPRIGSTIERAHHLAKSGLDEARRAIGMLRGDELPGAEGIAAMASEFERDSDIPCRFVTEGSDRELGSETRLALYRVAQEALTNIRKHAHPERVEIRLGYEPDSVSLVLEDISAGGTPAGSTPASGTPAGLDGTGYGLTGMRERAELLGGTLTADPTGHGFRVELRVPA